MDSYNLQATEDQLNGLGQGALDERNFVANYNAQQVQNYKDNLGRLETKWGTEDKQNLEEFGAYQMHMGDASSRLYKAVKGGFTVADSQLVKKPMALYEGTKYVAKLPGRLLTKAPINDVFTGKQEVNNVDMSEKADFEPNLAQDTYGGGDIGQGTVADDQMVDFYSNVKNPSGADLEETVDEVGGLYKNTATAPTTTNDGRTIETSAGSNEVSNPPAQKQVNQPSETTSAPAETDAGSTTETGVSTGTKVAGAVDEGAEASEGVVNTSRMAKLGASLKGGLSTAGTVAEGVGKVAGTVASGVFLGMDINDQISSGKFFYGDDTAQNVGNTANEIGSAMDIVGVATGDPLLVALGVGASAIGGIVSGLDELFSHKKKEANPAQIKQEQLQKAQTIKEKNVGVDTSLAGGGALAQATTSTLRQ